MKFYQKLIGLATDGTERIIEFTADGFKFNSGLESLRLVPPQNETGTVGSSTLRYSTGYFNTTWTNSVKDINNNWLIDYSNGVLGFSSQGDFLFSWDSDASQMKFEGSEIWTESILNLGKADHRFLTGFFTTIDTSIVKISGKRIRKDTTSAFQSETPAGSGILVSWSQGEAAPASCVFTGIWDVKLGSGGITTTTKIPLNIYNTWDNYITYSHSFIYNNSPYYILFEIRNNQGDISIKGGFNEIWFGSHGGSANKTWRVVESQITGLLL